MNSRSICFMICFYCLAAAAATAKKTVCLKVSVNSYNREAENDNRNECVTDVHESLLPDLVAQTHCLECAPETVAKVKAESYEPSDVENYNPKALECLVKKEVRVFSVLAHELLELHLSPEVVEVESDEAENYDSEKKHVL